MTIFPADHKDGGKLRPCGFQQPNPLHVKVEMDLDDICQWCGFERYEDSTLIKLFFSVQWFDGKQRRLVAVSDGQWWWRRRLRVLGEVLGEEMEKKWLF